MPIAGFPSPPTGVDNNGSQNRGWGTGWPVCQSAKQTWITLANGVRLQVRREVAELARTLLNECLRRGYQIRDDDSAGFVCRAVTGTPIPSNHSWGLAIDLNWRDNPMGTTTTDFPRWMVELFWSYRWYWGGWYQNEDPMHLEYVGTPAQAIVDTARAKAQFEEDTVTAKEVWDYPIGSEALGIKARPAVEWLKRAEVAAQGVDALARRLAVVEAKLGTLEDVDEPAIAKLVLAGLDPKAIAAALPDEIAAQVADELARRLAGS